jgi:hypothetical protein
MSWLCVVTAPPLPAASLAIDGTPRAEVYVADEASATERTAARELVEYLSRITGAPFDLRSESEYRGSGAAILVGPTAAARASETPPETLGGEEWVVRSVGERLLLFGGRPRGTLYAVYEFLERHLGVRWWNPYEESVPRRPDLEIPLLDERGAPAFAYRDISLGEVSRVFAAHSRLNGHFGRAMPAYGGARSYGPPHHAHTFYLYVSPEELLETHPNYFSEIGGLRFGGQAQLCLTDSDLPELVAGRMARTIDASRREAAREGRSLPTLFSFSQNDWERPCECERCRRVVAREGSESGPVIEFVNELARRLARDDFELRIDTLAYHYTLDPPRHLRTRSNVVVRLSGLHQRDFAASVQRPTNARYRAAVEGWAARTDHLWIWDYAVVFGDFGDLPIPNLRPLGTDYAWYVEQGVEGVYLQAAYPISADLRDLKLWVAAKLLYDPARDVDDLIEEFTEGFYGPAGPSIRSYVELVERAARRRPSSIGYLPDPAQYHYLDRKFFRAAHRRFDRAERRVAEDEVLLRRVRHARLSLDRASLVFWPVASRACRDDWETVSGRYRETWRMQLELRPGSVDREAVMEEVDREIAHWSAQHPR